MLKYFFSIVFIFLISSYGYVYSQSRIDSTVSSEDTVSVQSDSSASYADSSESIQDAAVTYINDDSSYMPVKDSTFQNSYAIRQVSQTQVNKWLEDPDYEYANDPEYWEKEKSQKHAQPSPFRNFFLNKIFQWFLFLSVIAVIAYGLYQLAKENNFRWFGRSSTTEQQESSDSPEAGPENYDEAIRKYQSEGNYRLAIRFLFLRLIQSAAQKNVIRIQESSTNTEIKAAFGQHPLATQFRYLATAYEYVYFGGFNLSTEIFDSLKTQFEVFQEKISA